MENCVIYCTVPNDFSANLIASTLVDENLAACVNIVPSITSIYKWEGSVQTDSELLLIIKTQQSKFNDVEKRMKQLQTGAGIELELIYKSLICSNAFSIEKDVHKHFENYRTFGEWFKINPTDVINFLEKQTFVLKSEFVKYVSLAC